MFGYMGKMAFVDLTERKIEIRELSEEIAKNFLGGPALGAKILYEEMPPRADVFGEDSMVGFISGPLNDSGALFGGRYTVVSKSPVTGGWNDANSGGFFGPDMKRSGYDAVFVKGKSQTPVYIFIDNGEIEILSAKDFWKFTVSATEEALKSKHGNEINAAIIGPAGVNRSNFAAVMNDGHRAAGRGGTGAVLGSKKLKALVVCGTMKTSVANPGKMAKINKSIQTYMANNPAAQDFAIYGTGQQYPGTLSTNDSGIKNWTGSTEDFPEKGAEPLGSKELQKYVEKRYFCDSCTMGCSSFLNIPSKRWDLSHTTRPEYETMSAFGSLMLNNDVEAVCRANDLCNEYGFDTMSAGSTIAWAMECYNNGIISKEEMGGIELTWGNGEAIVAVMEAMCKNEGIGRILIKGSQGAADELQKGHEYLVVAGGIEEPQHDSRYYYGLGRTYMSDPTPGRHVKGSIDANTLKNFDPNTSLKGTGLEDMLAIVDTEIMNASGLCSFGFNMAYPDDTMMQAIEAATGFAYATGERIMLGVRMFTMRQAFNLREGIRRGDFKMSKRMKQAKPPFEGPIQDISLDFDIMVDNLYNTLGWEKNGVPLKHSLEAVGALDNVIANLYGEVSDKMKMGAKSNEGLPAYFMRRRSR